MQTYKEVFNKITKEVKNHQQQKDYSKFKKIDAHEHITEEADFEKYLEVMDYFNIEKVFLMPTGKDYQREDFALKLQQKYPDKIKTFAFLDSIGNRAEDHLKGSIKKGAKGLKLLLWHPNIYTKNKIRMDSEPVYRLFKICDKANIPVLAHMSLANFPEHREQLENTLNKFRKLILIIPHYLGAAPKLQIVDELLAKYSNLYTDVSMGGGKNRYVAYIQGFRKRFRNFFKKNHNRLFWGGDFFIGQKSSALTKFYYQRIKHDINMLDETFFYSPFYNENRYLRGLNLADWILEDVFYNNAKRVLKDIL